MVFMDVTSRIESPHLSDADLERLIYLRSLKPARSTISRNSTRGDKIADIVTNIVGSWRFILIQSCLLITWIILNIIIWISHWDPYPFILLNLALSFQAAYATPFILMSQNRQSTIDRENAQQDLDCDLKAEMEIELLHEKLDSLRTREIADLYLLIQSQSETIAKIEKLLIENHPND